MFHYRTLWTRYYYKEVTSLTYCVWNYQSEMEYYIHEKLLSRVWPCFCNTLWTSPIVFKMTLKHFKILLINTENNARAVRKPITFTVEKKNSEREYWNKELVRLNTLLCSIASIYFGKFQVIKKKTNTSCQSHVWRLYVRQKNICNHTKQCIYYVPWRSIL